MTDKIIEILKSEGIENWLIVESHSSSYELFFIRRSLDARREKTAHKFEVTVYRDFELDGKKFRGQSTAHIFPTMSGDEIKSALSSAYYAASFVKNPFFELAGGEKDKVSSSSRLSEMTLAESASEMASALYSVKETDTAFINSSEIFSKKSLVRIVKSDGTDVSFDRFSVSGEFVVQCTEKEDVEFYSSFDYDDLNTDQLAEKAYQALESVRARSGASGSVKAGSYSVIISGEELSSFLGYYLQRANAGAIVSGYSDYEKGTKVQGENVKGELLNITVSSSAPFSAEGIRMPDRRLISDGKLELIHGSTRFSRYLGIEPVGYYGKMILSAGKTPLAEMKKEPYLEIVKFSDFDMDFLTGHFGGEIRLAYYFDGEKTTPVTGGSINGIIDEVQTDLAFSTEQYADSEYQGPLAVKLKNVTVAG